MKCLLIGANRFVGLRVAHALDRDSKVDLHILNRTGQVTHTKRAAIYKGDRRNLAATFLDRDWDVIIDFANFSELDARTSLDYFRKVSRYIMISTASVYNGGSNRGEEDFDPRSYDLSRPALENDYQDGKRRAEAVFAQLAPTRFKCLYVRFPFILGPDDYTGRLDFHVDRMRRQEAIHIPNLQAKITMIHSEDAARFVLWVLSQPITGPINVGSRQPISLADLLGQIELVTDCKPILAKQPTPDNESPYGPLTDSWLNTLRAEKAGFFARPILEWLPSLIGKPPDTHSRQIH